MSDDSVVRGEYGGRRGRRTMSRKTLEPHPGAGEDEVFEWLKEREGPWKVYPNPMRDDGVFIAQDKPRVPYEGVTGLDESHRYPAVPQDAYGLGFQIPRDIAENVVRRLNALQSGGKG